MKALNVRFEQDPSQEGIEIVVRASAQDGEVSARMERLAGEAANGITVTEEKGKLRVLSADEIILVSMDGKQVKVITADGQWYVRQTLQSVEEQLDSRRFIRISRFELVNLNKVTRYDFTISGTLRLELEGGMETWASRRCIPEIRRRLLGKGGSSC